MSLLADSTTSPGAMQRHLVRLLAHGASGATKAAQFITDPLDPVKGILAHRGSDLILRSACAAKMAVEKPAGTDAAAWNPSPTPTVDSVSSGTDWDLPWARRVASGMIARTLSMDDLDHQRCKDVNPWHGRLLSLLLSMLMSGATSGGWSAMDSLLPADLPFLPAQAVATLASTAAPSAAPFSTDLAVSALQSAPSLRTSPSLAQASAVSLMARHSLSMVRAGSVSHEADGVVGVGGMAMSTAMRMLRADSKHVVIPDLGNFLDSVLDTVIDSMDEGERAEATAAAGRREGETKAQSQEQTEREAGKGAP